MLTGLAIREDADGFRISYDGEVASHEGRFSYTVAIVAAADGRLRVEATGRSLDGFSTNRTGFVVLHALEGVAGHPLEVTHPDGSLTRTAFPRLVMPDQPATAIARLRHEPAPGVSVELRFDGDEFEMEDHRNWDRCVVQNLCPAAVARVSLPGRAGRDPFTGRRTRRERACEHLVSGA